MSNLSYKYASDYSTCTFTFTLTPLDSSVELTGAKNVGWSSYVNYSKIDWSYVNNADGSKTFTNVITFKSDHCSDVTNIDYGNSSSLIKVNGHPVFERGFFDVPIWKDHAAPIQNEIVQKDQSSANGWATIKELTLSGTEETSDVVRLTISDKITGEKYLTNAVVPVIDDKYSYTCTPPIEGDANGRTYVVIAADRNGNTSTKEFVVSKTDGSAPALKSGTSLSYTNWTTSKNISLSFYDFGAGGVQASLDNQTSYRALTKSGEYYVWTHKFGNHVGTTAHKLYVKDALGNATVYTLIEGNTDDTVYTITYNLNGGSTSKTLKTTYTVEDSFTLPNDLSKTGYTFQGWVGSNGSTANKNVSLGVGTRGNLMYTANFKASNYNVTIMPNGLGGSLTPTDSSISKNVDGSVGFTATYNSSNYYALGLTGSRNGYKFAGVSSAADGGTKLWDVWGTCLRDGTYWNSNYKWIHPGNATLYAQWDPITWTIKYDGNNATSGSMADTTHVYNGGIHITHNAFTRLGYSFNGWIATRVRNGTTEYLCGTTSNGFLDGSRWYEKDKIPSGMAIYKWRDNETAHICTYIDKDIITLHAQWTYNPIQVKIPQTVIGSATGASQFRISCDNIKSGNIVVSVPKTFTYTQSGKTNVTAVISNKSGNNIITPSNKTSVYNITAPKGLSAGNWQGIFNIGLTLTKE